MFAITLQCLAESSIDVVVGYQGQEFCKIGRLVMASTSKISAASAIRPPLSFSFFLGDHSLHHFPNDWAAISESGTLVHPLPDLGPANFRGCGVFHQVVNGNASRYRAATIPNIAIPTSMFQRKPSSVILPSATASKSFAVTHTSSRRRRDLIRLFHVSYRTPLSQSEPGRDAPPRCHRVRPALRAICPDGLSQEPFRLPQDRS